jgi:hypothetical protein
MAFIRQDTRESLADVRGNAGGRADGLVAGG